MANGSVNIVKQALFLQINQTERIADVFTVIINDFRMGAKLAELFLKSIALQDRTIIVVVVEGDHTYSFFIHKVLLYQSVYERLVVEIFSNMHFGKIFKNKILPNKDQI